MNEKYTQFEVIDDNGEVWGSSPSLSKAIDYANSRGKYWSSPLRIIKVTRELVWESNYEKLNNET